ncbi:MAG: class I SAM-dependent methyltransferase [Acidimicrobiales bacterium]|nr:class I SAM-dependent methyltransferase [Acidimicrobiales bacterium]
MDHQAWNDRYRQRELVWSAGPNQFVVEHTAGLTPGRALDVACGEGRNAVWLAEQGWDVVATDFSDVAIDKARRIAEHRGVTIDLRVADAVTGDGFDPDGDGVEPFDLIVVAYLQLPDDQLAVALARAATLLAPGGTILVIGHHLDNLEGGHGGPQQPEVLHVPDAVAAHLTRSDPGLRTTLVETVHRVVDTDDGPRTAIDSLVVAVGPGT